MGRAIRAGLAAYAARRRRRVWWIALGFGGEIERPLERCARLGTIAEPDLSEARELGAESWSAGAGARDARGLDRRVDRLIDAHPSCAAVWSLRAALRHARGDDAGALADLRAAAAADPDSPHVARALAVALHREGAAGEALERAIAAWPEDGWLGVLRARELPPSERPERLRAAARRHAGDAEVALAAVEALAEAGRPLEAAALGREALTYGDDPALRWRVEALEAPFAGPAPERARRPAEVRETAEGLEVLVFSPERARLELERRLEAMGWTEAQPIPGGMRYRSAKPVQPYVDVLDSGDVLVQESGLVKAAPLPDGATMIPVISARKLRPDRVRVMEGIWYEVTAWRQALSSATFQREVDGSLADRLTALWERGEPLSGTEPLPDPGARRAVLLEHWATRACTPDGAYVRAAVERFLRNVVQDGPHPVTDEERRAAEDRCPCDGVALDLGPPAGTP